jgi:hypothetical protein
VRERGDAGRDDEQRRERRDDPATVMNGPLQHGAILGGHDNAPVQLLGIDFTSAPRRVKPITVARGRFGGGARIALERIDELPDFAAFDALLREPGPWLGGFDFPFGLPRELVERLGWPRPWLPLMRHVASLDRTALRATFAAFCAARPAGAKFAHRACDRPAGSSPSMKWVNPPVAFMLHAGVPRLIDAGVQLPGLHAGDPTRIALEAYPGLLARELIGMRSYKSDERTKQTRERMLARKDLVDALAQGRTRLHLGVKLTSAQRVMLVDDASGDRLDALLCLVQAAWASMQPNHGLPADIDPLEGWIVSASPSALR